MVGTWPRESYRYTTIQNKIKTALHIDVLVDQRDQLNKRKLDINKTLEAITNIKKDERIKPSSFTWWKLTTEKEEIFVLIYDGELGTETRVPKK